MNTPKYHQKKEKMKNKSMSFSYTFVTNKPLLNKLRKLDQKKLVRKVIFQSKLRYCLRISYNNFNSFMISSNFPSDLENATIMPIFKKKDRGNVGN